MGKVEHPFTLEELVIPPGSGRARRVDAKASGVKKAGNEKAKINAPLKQTARKNFAIVPLKDDWGYRALTVAERGAAIVAYALYIQRATGKGDVPITAALLRRCGIGQKVRMQTINRLVAAGFATSRRRGKNRGCPLLTLILPPEE
jgi:hypothetical protein